MLTMLTTRMALVGFMILIDTGIAPKMAVSRRLCMTQDEIQTVAQQQLVILVAMVMRIFAASTSNVLLHNYLSDAAPLFML